MSNMKESQQITIQAKLFDFALESLVLCHRESFHPLWTLESWVKFLIWMSLNCGLSGESESLELFALSLGTPLTKKIRRLFFERSLDDLELKIMADPAEDNVFMMTLSQGLPVSNDLAEKALKDLGLRDKVFLDQRQWKQEEGLLVIPRNKEQGI